MNLKSRVRRTLLFCVALFFTIVCRQSDDLSAAETPPAPAASDPCPTGAAVVSPDGVRRLALVVGVGQYKKPAIPDLAGPPRDAQNVYDLLTGKNGYGFPKENVCLLRDADATTARFWKAFDELLVGRAAGTDDVVVLYFAGHGSQATDVNGDEPDDWDETLMLHDSRDGGTIDVLDDELNARLVTLLKKTKHVTAILDSCNSGSAARGSSAFTARFFDRLQLPRAAAVAPGGDGAKDGLPQDLAGLVFFSAASDGTPALETEGSGIFTDAVIHVLSQVGAEPLIYAQAAVLIPLQVRARSYQVAHFQGDLDRVVFGNKTRTQPPAMRVHAVGPPLELHGPPQPGMGKGAELRIYEGNATGPTLDDPGKAKARAVVQHASGPHATATIVSSSSAVAAGDLAILVTPAETFTRLAVRLRPPSEPGGLSAAQSAALRKALDDHPGAKLLVSVTDRGDEFEVGLTTSGQTGIWGPENRLRNEFAPSATPSDVAKQLWQHARQKALLQDAGEGGSDFKDNKTLQVEFVPVAGGNACARGSWTPAPANQPQTVPLCHKWKVGATLAADAPRGLAVCFIALGSDGYMDGFPKHGREIVLQRGESTTFDPYVFTAGPPLDLTDYVIVVGAHETKPISCDKLTSRPDVGARGLQVDGAINDKTWTRTVVPVRVIANHDFDKPKEGQPITAREYTIEKFDIRPYLPADRTTTLYKVLQKAHTLATHAASDGVPYKQHDWSGATDDDNLRKGIDCSRAIWYAFTRADLKYNRHPPDKSYLSTAGMVGAQSLMADEFDACAGEPQLGDILVYRDATDDTGHVVMVIDYPKRIGWGSHGWDGNRTADLPQGDRGVEYQLIKYKKDWERWDRATMEQKACWRYRAFAKEAKDRRTEARLINSACNPSQGCGRQ